MTSEGIRCLPVTGIGEVMAGDDLAALIAPHVSLSDNDIIVVTSKVVSKAEGRLLTAERSAVLADETDRTVATRGSTSIVRTRLGLVMAAAGIDASNTRPGTVVLLPLDPDGSARALRTRFAEDLGRNVAVVVTDTSGRAWRNGQTDIAIGAAGIETMHDHVGATDDHGNVLEVTAPAVADEIAGAADLVMGKVGGIPAAVIRGLGWMVLPSGEHGPGARALIRGEDQDMFGYGARDAVVAALEAAPPGLRGFGKPASSVDLRDAFDVLVTGEGLSGVRVTVSDDGSVDVRLEGPDRRAVGRVEARLVTAAFALGWLAVDVSEPSGLGSSLRFQTGTP